ncbi:MAG: T9SS type A sorting domain-containing protein [Ignavibacteria bacterium]
MNKIIFVLLQIIFITMISKAADTVSAKYLPLAVGNKWVYLKASSMGGSYIYSITVTQITKDTVINNRKYFYTNIIPSVSAYWIRYDSTNGQIKMYANYAPDCNYERMYYDLSVNVGDSCNNSYMPCTMNNYYCTQIKDTSLFGIITRIKTYYYSFSIHNGGSTKTENFAKNIGCYSDISHVASVYGQNHNIYTLKGFVINGQLYGDTTLTFINTISTNIPGKYSLSQNYPNPFNPRTVISFQLPAVSDVMLKVYDVTGKEVTTLVNESLQPGTYETTFDGSGLNSGVYFYKLIADGFTETKRMLLVK